MNVTAVGHLPQRRFDLRLFVRHHIGPDHLIARVFQQLRQRALDGDLADIRAFGHDFTLGDLAEVVLDDLPHTVGLGQALGGQQLDPAREIPVRRHQNTQHIGDKGCIVVGSLVPVAGAFLQRLVIGLLSVGDQLFDADILAHDIAGAVQEQQRQEPAHAAVAIVEGVDAEKVQYKDGNQQQRVEFSILHSRFKRAAQCGDGLRRFPRRNRLKPDNLLTVRQFFGNHVIRIFEAAADGLPAVFVQIPVKLQNDRWLWRNEIVAFMDRCKHIAVSSNLFFTASLGHGFLADDLFQAVICCDVNGTFSLRAKALPKVVFPAPI